LPVPERQILVAPGGFAGELRAPVVAAAIGRGLERAGLRPPDLCPVAEGGPGTLEVLLTALGGETAAAEAPAPDGGRLRAGYARLEDGATALVEAAGLDGRGTGALLCAAAEAGAAVVLLAPGGALGPAGLREALAEHGGLRGARVVVLCDERAPYRGDVAGLLRDPRGVPMTGSGAGLAGVLWALGAALEPGGPWVLDALGFDARMRAARAVVAGAGRLEEELLRGPVLGEIGRRARQGGVPLHAIVGTDALDPFGKRMIDLQRVLEAPTVPALEDAGELLGRELAEGLA
jgi:glycerate kinase